MTSEIRHGCAHTGAARVAVPAVFYVGECAGFQASKMEWSLLLQILSPQTSDIELCWLQCVAGDWRRAVAAH